MFFNRLRRNKIKRQPFSREWLKIVEKNISLYNHLPNKLQHELQNHIKVFISEKNFEGCGGLKINDEIKVTIAAQACILLLNRKTNYYHKLISILVYPTTFVAPRESINNVGIVTEAKTALLGESWQTGVVVIAWDDVVKGGRCLNDGQNLIFHEFAHQLDAEDNVTDGTPILENRADYVPWVKVMSRNYKKLLRNIKLEKNTLLGRYASTNAAEFFAVTTEYFFEKPVQLQKQHPDLYSELKKFYKQDPITYFKGEPK